MFKNTINRIKNFSLRKFISKTFKICFHKFEPKESENQFGKFKFDECDCCGKTKNTEMIKKNPKSKIKYSQIREDRLSKILDK